MWGVSVCVYMCVYVFIHSFIQQKFIEEYYGSGIFLRNRI